jgi:hypothetical protein
MQVQELRIAFAADLEELHKAADVASLYFRVLATPVLT